MVGVVAQGEGEGVKDTLGALLLLSTLSDLAKPGYFLKEEEEG